MESRNYEGYTASDMAPEKEDEFESIVVRDDFYHPSRFESIFLSLIQGIAIQAPEKQKRILQHAVELTQMAEELIDSAQG